MDRSRRPPRANTLALIALFFIIATALLLIVFPPHEASRTAEASLPLPTARVLPHSTSAPIVVPIIEGRSQEPGVRSQEPEVRGQESGGGGQGSEHTSPPERKTQNPELETQVPTPQPSTLAAVPALPEPTLTATPHMLPPVPTLSDSAPAVPTLFPTQMPAAAAPPAPAAPARRIPILMYHYIRTVDQGNDPLGYDLSVTPDMFAAQMDWLQQQGYATVRMDALAHCLRGSAACPPKAVAITLDDGYADAYSTALPILQQYGFNATFYIISGRVGQPQYMGWNELAALRDAGMEIGAHTVDHLDMTTLDAAEDERQITQSKAELEQALGISVVSFCYPSGRYNAAIEQQVGAAGYWTATTTRQDANWSDVFGLPRIRIAGGKSLDYFAALVQGY